MTWAASMGTYINQVVRRFVLEETKTYKTPMDAGFTLTEEDFKEESMEDMKSLYRFLIGSIGFAATAARFDISFAVSVLSWHLAKPCTKGDLMQQSVSSILKIHSRLEDRVVERSQCDRRSTFWKCRCQFR